MIFSPSGHEIKGEGINRPKQFVRAGGGNRTDNS